MRALKRRYTYRARRAIPGEGDHLVGRGDHLGRRPVVALQPDHRGVGEAAGEVEQRPGGRPGEGVDRLVRVADHGQVVALTEPGDEHPLLQRGDVLELVDHETPVAIPELLGDLRVVLEGRGGVQ